MKHPKAMVAMVLGSSQVMSSCRKGWRKEKAGFWCLVLSFSEAKLLICEKQGNMSRKQSQSSQSFGLPHSPDIRWGEAFYLLHLSTDGKWCLTLTQRFMPPGHSTRTNVEPSKHSSGISKFGKLELDPVTSGLQSRAPGALAPVWGPLGSS